MHVPFDAGPDLLTLRWKFEILFWIIFCLQIIFCLWNILVNYSKGHVHFRLFREVVDYFSMVVWLVKTKQKRNNLWQSQLPARSRPIWINWKSSPMSQKRKLTCYKSWQPTSKHMKLYIEWNGDKKQRSAIFQKCLSILNLLLFKSFIADFWTLKISRILIRKFLRRTLDSSLVAF